LVLRDHSKMQELVDASSFLHIDVRGVKHELDSLSLVPQLEKEASVAVEN
jgi:hypothetical protein